MARINVTDSAEYDIERIENKYIKQYQVFLTYKSPNYEFVAKYPTADRR